MLPNPQFPSDIVTFTEKNVNRKVHFLWNDFIRHTSTESGGIPLSVLSTWIMTVGWVS